ncbi:MAG TPA: hypothetical protein GXZ77_07410 [Papillibacter sp.]|jgi:hypothetical protein|nr:hypothetical protein [Papillibacter sp.]
MARVQTSNAQGLKTAMVKWLQEYPGDTICALQIWYEGFGGCGVPTPEDRAAIEAVFDSLEDWKHIGDVRFEKFGVQNSYRRVKK